MPSNFVKLHNSGNETWGMMKVFGSSTMCYTQVYKWHKWKHRSQSPQIKSRSSPSSIMKVWFTHTIPRDTSYWPVLCCCFEEPPAAHFQETSPSPQWRDFASGQCTCSCQWHCVWNYCPCGLFNPSPPLLYTWFHPQRLLPLPWEGKNLQGTHLSCCGHCVGVSETRIKEWLRSHLWCLEEEMGQEHRSQGALL